MRGWASVAVAMCLRSRRAAAEPAEVFATPLLLGGADVGADVGADAGADAGTAWFQLDIPPGGRLVWLQVNVGPRAGTAAAVAGLWIVTVDAAGGLHEAQAGPCGGTWAAPLFVPTGVVLVGVEAHFRTGIDRLRFLLSTGPSPYFGGGDGRARSSRLALRPTGKAYRGTVRAIRGRADAAGLMALGFVFVGSAAEPPDFSLADTPPDTQFYLTVGGEIEGETAASAGRLTALFFECYPKLVDRFGHPTRPAPRSLRLIFKRGLKWPAYCAGAEVSVSVEWLQQHPDDIGLLTHELTHAVQGYRAGPGWLREGIADYSRHMYGPQWQPGWRLPLRLGPSHQPQDGYGVTARFLLWLDQHHAGAVDRLHRRLQDCKYTEEDFCTIGGKPLGELWAECVRDYWIPREYWEPRDRCLSSL